MANIIRWHPVREIASVQNLMDRLFDDIVRPNITNGSTLALDIFEDNSSYTVETVIPGVDSENIHINLHDDVLTIEAEIPANSVEGKRTLLQERTYGKFTRRVRLPLPVKSEAVEATYENGLLTLTLPKAESAQPRTINVRRPNHSNN